MAKDEKGASALFFCGKLSKMTNNFADVRFF